MRLGHGAFVCMFGMLSGSLEGRVGIVLESQNDRRQVGGATIGSSRRLYIRRGKGCVGGIGKSGCAPFGRARS